LEPEALGLPWKRVPLLVQWVDGRLSRPLLDRAALFRGVIVKLCPYCQEEIKENAVKCRHCTSSLLPIESPREEESKYITYVLDKDLVRFVKVSGSMLAIFLTAGAFLYGFDIKQAAKEVRQIKEEAALISTQVKEDQASINAMRAQVARLTKSAQDAFANIQENQQKAQTGALAVVAIQKSLSDRENMTLLTIKQEVPLKFRQLSEEQARKFGRKLWPVGSNLRIHFLDGNKHQHEMVKRFASMWLEFANVHFVWVDTPDAEIRISFSRGGTYSVIGTDALGVPPNKATTNFGWFTSATPLEEYKRTTLHEVGHMLGLVHEHQIPKVTIPWDNEALYNYYSGPPNNWTRQMVDREFKPLDYPAEKIFDPASIMLYPIDNSLTLGDFEVGWNNEISEGDKRFIAQLYPK
jgi:hypothetical protein